jgi:thioredoxin-like negative regulator of GroEL
MQFLTSEKDLNINKKIVLCFYSSELCNSIANMFFSVVKEISQQIEILCIDICYFDSIGKRFGILEIPTVLLINSGKELKRISGMMAKTDVDLLLQGY